jgi:hypothetical protein
MSELEPMYDTGECNCDVGEPYWVHRDYCGFEPVHRESYDVGCADERERCRAELREKIAEIDNDPKWLPGYESWAELRDWARDEAFVDE